MLAKRIYNTKVGMKLWSVFVKLINVKYIKVTCEKALRLNDSLPIQIDLSNKYTLPKIELNNISKKPKALFVMPFYGPDAVGQNNDLKIKALKKLGYEIHTVMYNSAPWNENSELWDFVYHVKVQNKDSYQLKVDHNKKIIPDGHNIDDWCGDELVQFIASLNAVNEFDVAVINYVYLSKVALYLPNVTTYLDTHDIFANRNTRMQDNGVDANNFYYSTTLGEENKGLSRFDYVIAIQEDEGKYFEDNTQSKVVVLPPVFTKRYLPLMSNSNRKLKIGFIASGHYPNIVAIKKFISAVSNRQESANIELKIAGSICPRLSDERLPSFVSIEGFVDCLSEFYSDCDVIVNPDELLSGLKVKSLEALSFGKPLVCTIAASAGVHSQYENHHFDSAELCAEYILKLTTQPELLNKLSKESQTLYDEFSKRYSVIDMFKTTLHRE